MPRGPAPRRRRVAVWIVGPVLWAVLIAGAAVVLHHLYSVELALVVTGIAFLVGLVVLLPVALRRDRRDSDR